MTQNEVKPIFQRLRCKTTAYVKTDLRGTCICFVVDCSIQILSQVISKSSRRHVHFTVRTFHSPPVTTAFQHSHVTIRAAKINLSHLLQTSSRCTQTSAQVTLTRLHGELYVNKKAVGRSGVRTQRGIIYNMPYEFLTPVKSRCDRNTSQLTLLPCLPCVSLSPGTDAPCGKGDKRIVVVSRLLLVLYALCCRGIVFNNKHSAAKLLKFCAEI